MSGLATAEQQCIAVGPAWQTRPASGAARARAVVDDDRGPSVVDSRCAISRPITSTGPPGETPRSA
jgi:hypothetical protein